MESSKEFINTDQIRNIQKKALSGLSYDKRQLLETPEMQKWIEENLVVKLADKISDTGPESQQKFKDFLATLERQLEDEMKKQPKGREIALAIMNSEDTGLINLMGIAIFKNGEAKALNETGREPWESQSYTEFSNVFWNICRAIRRALRSILGGGIIPMDNALGEKTGDIKPPPEAPIQTSTQSPAQMLTEAPTQPPARSPTETSSAAPTQVQAQTPTQAPTEMPTAVSAQSPAAALSVPKPPELSTKNKPPKEGPLTAPPKEYKEAA